MNYNKILDFLYKRGVHTVDLGLHRIERLMKKLKNPQNDLKVILVTGTNGKGSTSTMIASILRECGYKVGLYTSPHLVRFTERFKIDGEEISKDDLEDVFDEIFSLLEDETYFEILTAMAYLYFKQQDVDFAVMEVGMGGRLDATNVCNPLVSVITNVSLDHTQYLGKTIREIAFEKAGIIKENGYAITAADGEAYEVLEEVCMKKQATLLHATPTGLQLGMKGEFQKTNAGVAIKTIKTLASFGVDVPKMALINGLEKAFIHGRLQRFKHNIIIDCAHNIGAMEELVGELQRMKENNEFKKLHIVFGAMHDKDISGMLELLEPIADTFILTRPRGEKGEMIDRAETPEKIAKMLSSDLKPILIDLPMQAIKKAQSIAKQDDLIVVCGSCFLAGDILRG